MLAAMSRPVLSSWSLRRPVAPSGAVSARAVPRKLAQARHLATISDLAHTPGLRLGLSPEFLGRSDGWPGLTVHALHEGDPIEPWETVMTIKGDYGLFAHLETVYLGTLARRSLVMTNVRTVVDAADGKSVLFFPARHDHWLVQTGDGWAAHLAGAIGVSTDANASWWGGRGTGTIPHALIAVYGGDTVAAARDYAARYAEHSNIICLVDFHNDSVGEAVRVSGIGDSFREEER